VVRTDNVTEQKMLQLDESEHGEPAGGVMADVSQIPLLAPVHSVKSGTELPAQLVNTLGESSISTTTHLFLLACCIDALHGPRANAVTARCVARTPWTQTKGVLLAGERIANYVVNRSWQQQEVAVVIGDNLGVVEKTHNVTKPPGMHQRG
jgi:hypothetical protein